MVLQPWSLPTSLLTMDMDGDGIVEQVISAGEMSLEFSSEAGTPLVWIQIMTEPRKLRALVMPVTTQME